MDHAKTLRAASVFILVIGILSIIVSLMVITVGSAAMKITENEEISEESGQNEYTHIRSVINDENVQNGGDLKIMSTGIAVTGIMALLFALFNVLRGVIGLKAVKGKLLTPALVIGVIGFIFDIIGLLGSLKGGLAVIAKIIYVLVAGVYIYCITALKKEFEAAETETFEAIKAQADNDISAKTIDDEAENFFK